MYHFDHVPIPTIVDLLNNISESPKNLPPLTATRLSPQTHPCPIWRICTVLPNRGVAASRFLGRQELVAYKVLVLTLGSMITIPMVWFM